MFTFAVRFSFPVLSQEIGWEEPVRDDLFCNGWCKTLALSVNQKSKVQKNWPKGLHHTIIKKV